jgi:preprotein translocase subunit SecA
MNPMWMNVLTRVFGTKNDRLLKQIQPLVDQINQLEPETTQLDDTALMTRTAAWKTANPWTI